MRVVEPKVFIVGMTAAVLLGISQYLEEIGASWSTDAKDGCERLTEFAGRLCYRSWEAGLNPNVTKVREGNQQYIENILKQRHGSVLEHTSVSFVFHNVSRVFTHELVRHRAGCAISQESLRYVRLTDIGFYRPACFEEDSEVANKLYHHVRACEELQLWLAEHYGLDNGKDFATKKQVTSAMRRLAPEGLTTGLMWTANVRAIRHVLTLRTALGAEEEIRKVFDKVGHMMQQILPNLFQDFSRSEAGEWIPKNEKV